MSKTFVSAKKADVISKYIIYGIVTIVCIVLAFILFYVLIKGVPVISIKFLTNQPESFIEGGGIGPEIFNSFYLLFITLLISIPLALGTAIYLSEYTPENNFTSLIKTAIEVLSSLPSIVVGLFGFLIFVIKLKLNFSILSGALALTVFCLPTLVRIIEQSLSNVSNMQREAALALGITKWECTKYILLPAAMPGIITGIILTSGRIFGEAATLIYTSGLNTPELDFSKFLNFFSYSNPFNLMRPAETLAVHIWKINSEGIIPDVDVVSNGTATVLIIFILVFNIMARVFGKLLYKKMTGE